MWFKRIIVIALTVSMFFFGSYKKEETKVEAAALTLSTLVVTGILLVAAGIAIKNINENSMQNTFDKLGNDVKQDIIDLAQNGYDNLTNTLNVGKLVMSKFMHDIHEKFNIFNLNKDIDFIIENGNITSNYIGELNWSSNTVNGLETNYKFNNSNTTIFRWLKNNNSNSSYEFSPLFVDSSGLLFATNVNRFSVKLNNKNSYMFRQIEIINEYNYENLTFTNKYENVYYDVMYIGNGAVINNTYNDYDDSDQNKIHKLGENKYGKRISELTQVNSIWTYGNPILENVNDYAITSLINETNNLVINKTDLTLPAPSTGKTWDDGIGNDVIFQGEDGWKFGEDDSLVLGAGAAAAGGLLGLPSLNPGAVRNPDLELDPTLPGETDLGIDLPVVNVDDIVDLPSIDGVDVDETATTGLIAGLLGGLAWGIGSLLNKLLQGIKALFGWLGSALTWLKDKLLEGIGSLFDSLLAALSLAWTTLWDWLSSISTTLTNIFNWFGDFSKLLSFITKLFAFLFNMIIALIDLIVVKIFGELIPKINSFVASIKGIFAGLPNPLDSMAYRMIDISAFLSVLLLIIKLINLRRA